MSTSAVDERQQDSVNETVCEALKAKNSIEDSKSACLSIGSDEQCTKLNNSINKESTLGIIPINNDSQDKTVPSDAQVNGSEEKICNDLQLDSDKDENAASVNKEDTLTRVNLTSDELCLLSKDELANCWQQQNKYISYLLSNLEKNSNEESKALQANEDKYKVQLAELQKKEQYHTMRLSTKEHEMQELGLQIDELKNCMGGSSLKYCMLDPATNLLFERMKRDMDVTKAKMEELQNELAAWKFTPDSNTGKQLMAKCRLLIKENEELGKMISSGRLSKLEGDLAFQRKISDEFKKSQSELDEFLTEMDEDTEGMQSTILFLQGELREAKERISQLVGQIAAQTARFNDSSTRSEVAGTEDCISYPNGDHCEDEMNFSTEQELSLEDNPKCVSADVESDAIDVGCKRTHSAIDDEFDGSDVCVSYKRERTKSPELIENGL